MKKQYQITLLCKTKQYKPVSCIVECEEVNLNNADERVALKTKGIQKICRIRGWSGSDLKKFSYTLTRVREYDKIKIAQEKAERYAKIKEEKYKCGEWKCPTPKKR